MVDVALAYVECTRLARVHYENFPVASWLLPATARPHIAAIYAFARGADDLADEGHASPEERLDRLAQWREWLDRATKGDDCAEAGACAPIFVALAASVHTCRLPLSLFDDLISAFRQDVLITRYDTWLHLLDYCRRSANPIGRLVLRVFGHDSPALDAKSDDLCSALQLTNFWQDLARDWDAGRLYVPREIHEATGATVRDFKPHALTPAWRAALADAVDRTKAMFERSAPICDEVSGRLRYELRLTWLGGTRILEQLIVNSHKSSERPTLGAVDALPLLWRFLTWPRAAKYRARP